MPIRSFKVGEVFYYQGMSTRSGMRTRIFANDLDAIYEEKWLDQQWLDIRNFWLNKVERIRQHVLDTRTNLLLQYLAKDAKRAMRVVSISPDELDENEIFEIFVSNDWSDPLNCQIDNTSDSNEESAWSGRIEHKRDVITKLAELSQKLAVAYGK